MSKLIISNRNSENNAQLLKSPFGFDQLIRPDRIAGIFSFSYYRAGKRCIHWTDSVSTPAFKYLTPYNPTSISSYIIIHFSPRSPAQTVAESGRVVIITPVLSLVQPPVRFTRFFLVSRLLIKVLCCVAKHLFSVVALKVYTIYFPYTNDISMLFSL